MSDDLEIRNPSEARHWVCTGLCLARTGQSGPTNLRPVLEWTLALVNEGHSLPPIALIADIGRLALGHDRGTPQPILNSAALSRWPIAAYEDVVLGKLYADRTFERGMDALRRIAPRDRVRAIAYLVDRFRARAGIRGTTFSPAIVKGMLEEPDEKLLAIGWAALAEADEAAPSAFREMIVQVRAMGDALGPEDIFELEHGTAVTAFGQRLALRQVIRAAARFEAALPHLPPVRQGTAREVPTQVLDEDTYPVGGFATIANRGSLESLLHSQLAYMETPRGSTPDLFDIKFLRDELLYYARDENQFFRRRRRFIIVFDSNLAQARIKDVDAPYQRIIIALGWLAALVARLTQWLERDALAFALHFPIDNSLAAEHELAGFVFREPIESGLLHRVAGPPPARHDSMVLHLSCAEPNKELTPQVSWLRVGHDVRWHQYGIILESQGKSSLGQWQAALEQVLAAWVS